MLIDHFWSSQYREFVACMETESEAPLWSSSPYYTIHYPPFSFSLASKKRVVLSLSFDAVTRKEHQLAIDDMSFLHDLPIQSSTVPRSKELIEAFSHPIMSAINRLLSSYLMDNPSEW